MGTPGKGGWPTVRYYTKETGIEGAAYEKKTGQSMCDELGDETYMQGIVEEKTGLTHSIRPTGKPPKPATSGKGKGRGGKPREL